MSDLDHSHESNPVTSSTGESRWVDIGSTNELRRARSIVVSGAQEDVAVFWNDGKPCALANICVHRDRELVRGMIFQDRLICPGHQWAFDVETGHCAERERTQPVYQSRVIDDRVQVDITAPVNADQLQDED